MPNSSLNHQSTTTTAIAEMPSQAISPNSTGSSDTFLALFALCIPALICGTILTHRRYRTLTLRQRIKRLEKIWQLPAAGKETTSWE